MARRVAVGLLLCVGTAAAADPSAPQIDPIHTQREDAQRIAQQHRRLDAVQPETDLPVAPASQPATDPLVTYDNRLLAPGIGLILVGAGAGVVALFPSDDRSDTVQTELLAAAAIATAAGLVFVLASRKVQIAPTATSHTVGLALGGRF